MSYQTITGKLWPVGIEAKPTDRLNDGHRTKSLDCAAKRTGDQLLSHPTRPADRRAHVESGCYVLGTWMDSAWIARRNIKNLAHCKNDCLIPGGRNGSKRTMGWSDGASVPVQRARFECVCVSVCLFVWEYAWWDVQLFYPRACHEQRTSFINRFFRLVL